MRRSTTGGSAAIAGSDADVPTPRRRRSGILDRDWLLAFSLAFAVGIAVWFGKSIRDYFAPATTTIFVPSFSGQTETDAGLQASRYKLKTVVVARRNSDRFPKGVVISQQPPPGARVREGRSISLVVSQGVVIYAMPDLRYSSLREARLELSHRRLQLVKTLSVANDEIPLDFVVAQDPMPLTSVREGSHVTLTISKGPPNATHVPNFANLPIDFARDVAKRHSIHLGQVVWTPFGRNGPARGVVVRQNPPAGATIDPFEPVSLQVSAGPTEYGYLVRQVHATVTVPLRSDTANVRVELRDDTGTSNVYNGFAQGGAKLDFTVTAIGSAQLFAFVNNELLSKTTLGVEPPRPSPHPATTAR